MKTHNYLIIASGVMATAIPHAQGATTWAAGAPGGSSGGSLDFDGSSFLDTGIASVDVGGNRNNGGTDYTVSMWINSDADAQQWFFGTGNQGLHLGVRSGGGADNSLSQGHWGADSDGTTSIVADAWNHATFTFDADGGGAGTGQQTIYLNGVMQSQTDKIASNNSSTNLILGGRNNGAAWDGQIDDLAIWNSVLSGGDIAAVAGGAAGNTLGAMAYWDFEDDQTGMTAGQSGIGGLGAGDFTGITGIPEPSSLALVLVGAVGLLRRKRS